MEDADVKNELVDTVGKEGGMNWENSTWAYLYLKLIQLKFSKLKSKFPGHAWHITHVASVCILDSSDKRFCHPRKVYRMVLL